MIKFNSPSFYQFLIASLKIATKLSYQEQYLSDQISKHHRLFHSLRQRLEREVTINKSPFRFHNSALYLSSSVFPLAYLATTIVGYVPLHQLHQLPSYDEKAMLIHH